MDKKKQKALDTVADALFQSAIKQTEERLKDKRIRENSMFVIAYREELLTGLYKAELKGGSKNVVKFLELKSTDIGTENSIFKSEVYFRDVADGFPNEALEETIQEFDKNNRIVGAMGVIGSSQSAIVPLPIDDEDQLNDMMERFKDFKLPILIAPGYYRNTKTKTYYPVHALICSDSKVLGVKDDGNLADPSSIVDTNHSSTETFLEVVSTMAYILVRSNQKIVSLIKSL